jgi:hypothetical protein
VSFLKPARRSWTSVKLPTTLQEWTKATGNDLTCFLILTQIAQYDLEVLGQQIACKIGMETLAWHRLFVMCLVYVSVYACVVCPISISFRNIGKSLQYFSTCSPLFIHHGHQDACYRFPLSWLPSESDSIQFTGNTLQRPTWRVFLCEGRQNVRKFRQEKFCVWCSSTDIFCEKEKLKEISIKPTNRFLRQV